MTNSDSLDRILQVDQQLQANVEKSREISTLIFESKESAKQASKLLGTTGTFSYQTASGDECWLPGHDVEELQRHCLSLKIRGRGAYKYRDPETQEYFYFERQGVHKKDGRQLIYMGHANNDAMNAIMVLFQSKPAS